MRSFDSNWGLAPEEGRKQITTDFYKKLQKELGKCNKTGHVIISGDLNVRISNNKKGYTQVYMVRKRSSINHRFAITNNKICKLVMDVRAFGGSDVYPDHF